jgi:hypothetical protein
VFSVDETCLVLKRIPIRTYISKDEWMAPRFKAAKHWVMVMLGGNANRDYKLKPVVIYCTENPRALRGFLRSSLPVCWPSVKNVWMSGPLFTEWISDQLQCELKSYWNAKDIDCKILCWIMLLDILLWLRHYQNTKMSSFCPPAWCHFSSHWIKE